MKIFNPRGNEVLKEVTLFLTQSEASEMRDALESLLDDPSAHHNHISNEDYSSEVTVAIYDKSNLKGFDEISKKILSE